MGFEDAVLQSKGRLEALLAPIAGGVGEDASYDEAFEAIKTEIDKVNALEGGTTDWNAIVGHAEGLLSDRSKDFRVALYYGVALGQRANTTALLDGLVLLLELSNLYWEPMYPALKRPRARGALCGWYSEVLTPIVSKVQPASGDRDAAQACTRVFRELDGLLAERLGEAYPGMMTLRDAFAGLERRVPADAPPPPPPAPPPPPKAPAPAPTTGPASVRAPQMVAPVYDTEPPPPDAEPAVAGLSAADISDPESVYRALGELRLMLARGAEVLLEYAPTSADAVRLAFLSGWIEVGGLPYNEAGQTAIDGPNEMLIGAMREQVAAGDWESALGAARGLSAACPLFLDAAHVAYQALAALGGDYDAARLALGGEAAALYTRAPGLTELSFSSGVAFASAETKAWLKGLGGSGGGGAPSGGALDKTLADAKKSVEAGDVPRAIQLLSKVANQTPSPAERFRYRLEIAKVAQAAQLVDIARVQLDSLEAMADEHRLAQWDPALAAEMYAAVYRNRKLIALASYDDPEPAKRADRAFLRLCELDAALALALSQELSG